MLLRQEEAKLMGYENHAAYELEIKMAKTPKQVFDFLNGNKNPINFKNSHFFRSHSKTR